MYDEWRGVVYPAELPQRAWFAWYAEHFDTVELNSTHYRLPTPLTVGRWADQAPPGFCYAVKVGRYGSHRKKLRDAVTWLPNHLDRVRGLDGHLGPQLIQLPPRWSRDVARLDEVLSVAPRELRWAVEVRDPSWLHDDVYACLKRHDAALCRHDLLPDHPWERTADWAYVRFHGPDALDRPYHGAYGTPPVAGGGPPRRLAGRGRRRLRLLQQRHRGARGAGRRVAPRPVALTRSPVGLTVGSRRQ